ncbi:hypothetical protein Shpa_13 [Paracoccus phage Shpa]|uniref:Uncharacterized protein n=1 Tax=Paracoccus phage Shpa TaxID=1647282 RepID=A0A0U2BUC2_9CAUD|nr:tail protein [Paracoccus phage Shpa]AKG94524.1 hypothetical protein Shpa_13 [Paracoccus phage Shpa]
MAHPKGQMKLTARGKEYTLWLGMSVLADLQAKYGNNVFSQIEPPADAGPDWMPPLNIVIDLFLGALQRHHADEADRYLVDDLIAGNEDALGALMSGSMPEPKGAAGKKPRRPA